VRVFSLISLLKLALIFNFYITVKKVVVYSSILLFKIVVNSSILLFKIVVFCCWLGNYFNSKNLIVNIFRVKLL